nr:MAG TPA: hypothetical protein [Caudoviricetes sp.]
MASSLTISRIIRSASPNPLGKLKGVIWFTPFQIEMA